LQGSPDLQNNQCHEGVEPDMDAGIHHLLRQRRDQLVAARQLRVANLLQQGGIV